MAQQFVMVALLLTRGKSRSVKTKKLKQDVIEISETVFISCDLHDSIFYLFRDNVYQSWETESSKYITQGSIRDRNVEEN